MKRIIKTPNAPSAIGPYSQAVECNNTLFISGQIPLIPGTGKLLEGDIKAQTDLVMKNIGAILEAAGYSYDNVVKYTVLLADMADFQSINEVFLSYYESDPPARATFAVAGLPLNVRIEIDTIAMK